MFESWSSCWAFSYISGERDVSRFERIYSGCRQRGWEKAKPMDVSASVDWPWAVDWKVHVQTSRGSRGWMLPGCFLF